MLYQVGKGVMLTGNLQALRHKVRKASTALQQAMGHRMPKADGYTPLP